MAEKNKGGSGAGFVLAAAAVAAAAGAYYIFGTKEGAKTKKKIQGWVLKLKGDVLTKLEGMKEVTQEKYDEVVDTVTQKYAKLKDVNTDELQALAKDMKKHWGAIQKTVVTRTKKAFK